MSDDNRGTATTITIAATATTSATYRAMFRGREHVVVPVVAMVGNAIITSRDATGPELVPAIELQASATGWNYRPVVPDHPAVGVPTANSPGHLESQCFGHLFNAHYRDGALRAEAWLDPELAAAVGDDAVSVIARCEAGEPVEVSVGLTARVYDESGTYDGRPYTRVWTSLVPDHFAMLRASAVGACSVAMGCGVDTTTIYAQESPPMTNPEPPIDTTDTTDTTVNAASPSADFMTTLRRLFNLGDPTTIAAELGTSDLYSRLRDAIRAIEPGYEYIHDVYPDSRTVVYLVCPRNEYIWVQRGYTVNVDDSVALSDQRTVVMPVTTFVPVSEVQTLTATIATTEENNMAPTTPTTTCTCGNTATHTTEESATMTTAATTTTTPIAASEQTTAAAATTIAAPAMTEEQWLAAAPADLRDQLLATRAAAAAEHAKLVTQLSASQAVFSADQLTAKPLAELQQLSQLVTDTDYTGRAGVVTVAATTNQPPRPYDLAMAKSN